MGTISRRQPLAVGGLVDGEVPAVLGLGPSAVYEVEDTTGESAKLTVIVSRLACWASTE